MQAGEFVSVLSYTKLLLTQTQVIDVKFRAFADPLDLRSSQVKTH
jgi:hypothetical protein